jgi:hypothetical protein
MAVSCEHGNEPLGPTEGSKCFDELSEFLLFKDSDP